MIKFVPGPRELPSRRVESELRRRLASDEWASGDALPPVAALAGEYGTSGATVSKVLRKLADEGLAEVVPRWGVFKV
jgi:GntR family histidine utilization transcriptional repressor